MPNAEKEVLLNVGRKNDLFRAHTTQRQKKKLYTIWVGNALPSAQWPNAWKKVVLDVDRKNSSTECALPNA